MNRREFLGCAANGMGAVALAQLLGQSQLLGQDLHHQAKAKRVRPLAERLVTFAKRGDLHARRQALSTLGQDKFIVHKLFEEVAPRYAERPGGYTRILKLGPRRSDSTEMVFIELV